MPEVDGWEFLNQLKKIEDQLTKKAGVYIISSSNHPTGFRPGSCIADRPELFPEAGNPGSTEEGSSGGFGRVMVLSSVDST